MKDWHVYSTVDVVNWTDRGSPLSLKTFAWARHDAWAAHWGDIVVLVWSMRSGGWRRRL